MNKLDKLQSKIFENKNEGSQLSAIFDIMREYSCVGEILGREFEVYDVQGNLTHKIVQKPMRVSQMRSLMKELGILRKIEADSMKKSNKKGNVNKSRSLRK